MSGHTPGPWQFLPEECDRPYIRIRGTQLGGRYKIANVLTPVYEGVHKREAEETRANARLIATAPDMLDALKMVRDYIVTMKGMGHEYQIVIDAAIAKAERTTP